jgi:gliding motility-associated-like protein
VRRLVLSICLVTGLQSLLASHLVGGDITYECLGNNNYRLKLTIFRDCNTGVAPFDPDIAFGIYNGTTLFLQHTIPMTNYYPHIPLQTDTCSPPPPTVCVEYAEYIDTLYLPPHPQGYNISHQRCCRNNSIVNLVNSGTTGNTWYASIPPNDTACNNSAQFLTFPSLLMCYQQPMEVDMPMTDADGDSLVFSLCEAYLGGGQQQNSGPNGIIPLPPTPPPYANPTYSPGYSAQVPITGSPSLTIDPTTGLITVFPDPVSGLFTVAICVDEYRDGIIINTVHREMQFVVANCVLNTRAGIRSQAELMGNATCIGRTIQFQHYSSGMQTAYWKFNDTGNAPHDTSTAFNPLYTFSDTGVYNVMLIINSGMAQCEDTAFAIFEVRDSLYNTFTYKPSPCLDKGLVFELQGSNISPDAIIEWDFGANATPSNFVGRDPPPVFFTNDGNPHQVTLNTEDYGCASTYTEILTLYKRVSVNVESAGDIGCTPFVMNLHAQITAFGPIEIHWDMDDGTTYSNQRSISHTYTSTGTYYPTVTVRTRSYCIDTMSFNIEPIEIFPSPAINLTALNTKLSMYEPTAHFYTSISDDVIHSEFHPGDGYVYDPAPKEVEYLYDADSAVFRAFLAVLNSYGCPDTAFLDIIIVPTTNLFIPNAFKPDGDGRNDYFKIAATNVKTYRLQIFNRWGQQVFFSEDPQHHWDGRVNGKAVPSGVYVYVLELTDNQDQHFQRQGHVTLVR